MLRIKFRDKLVGTLFCLLLMLSLFLPLTSAAATPSAPGYDAGRPWQVFVESYDGSLTEQQVTNALILVQQAADALQSNVGIVFTNELNGMSSKDYAEQMIEQRFGFPSDSVVLVMSNTFDNAPEHCDWIAATGYTADLIQTNTDVFFDKIYARMGTDGYYGAVVGFCEQAGVVVAEAPAYKVILRDDCNRLTDAEEQQAKEQMLAAAEAIKCNVACVITDKLQGMDERRYTEYVYENEVGKGTDAVVLLFCEDHVNYDYIYTYGIGTQLYGSCTDAIFDRIYASLDTQGYAAAIDAFCWYMKTHTTPATSTDYVDEFNYYEDGDAVTFGKFVFAMCLSIPIAGTIGIMVGIAIYSGVIRSYTRKKLVSTAVYIADGQCYYSEKRDTFKYETTHSYTESSSSDGSHHSGGSHSRSGGGGRSRSGGGGGRGRRR